MAAWLARIRHPNWKGYLELAPNWTWSAVGDVPKDTVESANLDARMHEESPSQGQPGAMLAHLIADQIQGATVELLKVPADPPGMVY